MPARVAHVISARGAGGAERFVAALVREGEARGWEQLVLNPFANAASPEFQQLLGPCRYEHRACDSPLALPSLRHWLRRELDAFRPDTVHVVLFHALVAMATIPRRPGTFRMATNVYGEALRVLPHARFMEALDRWAGRRFDRNVAISESVGRFLVDDYGYPPSLVTCIPLGWEGEPLPRSTAARPPTVVCVAKLRPEKGHAVLLDAFRQVHEQVPDARLVLVGEGGLQEDLERRAASLGLGESVRITGHVDSIWPYLAEADIFALASHSEAYGIAVVEAMACGLPAVVSDVGGLPELVTPGVSGELFAPGDVDALAGHLVRLLSSPELRERMGAAALDAARSRSLESSVVQYADLCEQAAVHGSAGPSSAGSQRRG